MTDRHHLLVYGGTFAAVGDRGDISGVGGSGAAAGSPEGLFVRDARHLSRWQLTVDGAVPEVLSPVADGDTTRCVLVPRGGRNEPPSCTLFREQAVGDSSFVESLRVVSNRPVPTTVRLAVTADADFTDQFELRSDHRTYAKTGVVRRRQILDDGVEFTYRRGEWKSCTTVTAEPVPDGVEETGTGARRLVWKLELDPHGSAELTLRVMARPHGEKRTLRVPRSPAAVTGQLLAREGEFVEGVAFPTGWPELAAACARGLADLAALQVQATGPDGEELRVPAAGAPWFLTLLGRDALLTSLFALPYRPRPAAATLLALAAAQATETGPRTVAQPGKIVHEMRHGELAHFGQVPYGRYYGSVDATPLFLVLLGSYVEQTRDLALARRLEPHARAAIGWMLDHGGLTSRGYLVYRADQGGLANQNWKDSPAPSAPRTAPARPVRCWRRGPRGTPTTRCAARRGWRAPCGRTRSTRHCWNSRPPTCGTGSSGTSGCGSVPSRRSPWTARAARSTRSPRTPGICSGRGCWTRSTGRPSAGGCSNRTSSPAGAYAPWRPGSRRTTRSPTTAVRSGRTTTR